MNNTYVNMQGPYDSVTMSSKILDKATIIINKNDASYNTIANTFADISLVNQIVDKLNRQNRLNKRNRWRNTRLKKK